MTLQINKVGNDAYHVKGFLCSDERKECVVFFNPKNDFKPEIHHREGLTHDESWCEAWDEAAIAAVRAELITHAF